MKPLLLADVTQYVEDNIGEFHHKRVAKLESLSLKNVLRRKNPYLFRAKHLLTSHEVIQSITDASISSTEETLFGDWLEGLAIFINQKVYNGFKSGISNIDLEFEDEGIRYIVNIKSGPNWGNSSQISKMKQDFDTAKRTLRTSNSKLNIIAVNGCCYGKGKTELMRGDYFKYCGQDFWHFISGDPNLYKNLIEPLGHQSAERNEEFEEAYAAMLNRLTANFTKDFCYEDGRIDWDKFVQFNSASKSLNP